MTDIRNTFAANPKNLSRVSLNIQADQKYIADLIAEEAYLIEQLFNTK